MIKHHLGEIGEGIIKTLNEILIGKTHVKRNATYYLYQNLIQLVVLTCWKRCTFQISMKFNFKNKKFIFETLFSPSFDVLYSSPIVYMDHTELIFEDLLLYCTKKVAENHNQFSTFVPGVKHTYWCLLRPWYKQMSDITKWLIIYVDFLRLVFPFYQ